MDRQQLLAALPHTLTETNLPLPAKYPGKVRDTYDLSPQDPEGHLLLITTDRQSGFDRNLGSVPFKGQVLNRASLYWFNQTAHIAANHVVSSPHANALIARKCRVLPIEFVVRGYLTGSTDTSIYTQYTAGQRDFGGLTLPEAMRKNDPLPRNLITPTTKEATHDRPITPEEILSEKWLTPEEWAYTSQKALELFAFGQKLAKERGLILVDTKYEFGVTPTGEILLIDEIHTPDSSRYWIADSYVARVTAGHEPEMIDKEFLRLWFRQHCDPYKDAVLPTPPNDLIAELSSRYIQLFEKITATQFTPDLRPLEPTIMEAVS
ncbi:MAG: phosphoribosylaminoimidazolesuccinocarboxamide synthase [Acidobacteriota bacterium]